MSEYNLKKMYKSPNGTIRAILDGTVFRAPIVVKGIEPCVKNWKKPITIARHAYGDVYKNTEMYIDKPGDAMLVFKGEDGEERTELIHHFDTPGVIQGVHNLDKSITSFAKCCFNYALDTKQNLWFGGKDTISKTYDGKFKEIFHNIYEAEFKEKFEAAGITFFYSLIFLKNGKTTKIFNVCVCKSQILNIFNYLLQSCTDSKTASAWVITVKHVEYDSLVSWVLKIPLHHGKFIEIREQSQVICSHVYSPY